MITPLALPLVFLSVPRLAYLNTRIDQLHAYLCNTTLTSEQRYVAAWDLAHSMMERYYIMEERD